MNNDMLPTPPVNCTPPSATAVTDSRLKDAPIVGSPEATREAR